MTYDWQRDLADVLRAALPAGYVVVEDGWEDRGRPGGTFTPRGVMLHHDASPPGETSNGVDVIRDGRPGLEGPLAQLWLRADGVWHVVAAGRASHAGEGQWEDIPPDDGNELTIGVETDHTTNEQWYTAQALSGVIGVRALCQHFGVLDSEAELRRWLMAHKEYAPSRKVDPDPLDMDDLRAFIYDPPPLEGFMAQSQIRKVSTQPQTIDSSDWTALRIDEDTDDDAPGTTFGIVAGPTYFVLDVAITTQDGKPGAVMIRAVNTEGDRDNVKSGHPILQHTATDPGPQHYGYHAQGHVPEGQWLRMQVAVDDELTATKVETRVTLWGR